MSDRPIRPTDSSESQNIKKTSGEVTAKRLRADLGSSTNSTDGQVRQSIEPVNFISTRVEGNPAFENMTAHEHAHAFTQHMQSIQEKLNTLPASYRATAISNMTDYANTQPNASLVHAVITGIQSGNNAVAAVVAQH